MAIEKTKQIYLNLVKVVTYDTFSYRTPQGRILFEVGINPRRNIGGARKPVTQAAFISVYRQVLATNSGELASHNSVTLQYAANFLREIGDTVSEFDQMAKTIGWGEVLTQEPLF